ncbi:hypothetical protein ABW21_db0204481 [Orbilia brochopaga]|nr:hypothetical protein ABW21_db0204481 [Drechslerella brochopaga]
MLSGKSKSRIFAGMSLALMFFAPLFAAAAPFIGPLARPIAPRTGHQGPPGHKTAFDEATAAHLSAKEHAKDVIERCKSRGIDMFSGIPSDAKLVPMKRNARTDKHDSDATSLHHRADEVDIQKEDYVYVHKFEAGSNASLWATAQVFAGQFPELFNDTEGYHKSLEEREVPHAHVVKLGVGLWEGGINNWYDDPRPCEGAGFWVDNVVYDHYYFTDVRGSSVGISYRKLKSYNKEWLEMRDVYGWQCNKYEYAVGENTYPGCWRNTWSAVNCFILRWRRDPPIIPNQVCWNDLCTMPL